MSSWPRHVMALAACAVVLIGGCGADQEEAGPGVPRDIADQLGTELDLVQERLDVTRDKGAIGSCKDIDIKSYPEIERLLERLPEDTDPDVRDALVGSVDQLKQLTEGECSDLEQEIRDRREETTPQVTTPQPPPPQQTVPQPTQTVPQPKQDQRKEKKPKDEGDQDDGNGEGGTATPEQGGGGQPAPLPEEE